MPSRASLALPSNIPSEAVPGLGRRHFGLRSLQNKKKHPIQSRSSSSKNKVPPGAHGRKQCIAQDSDATQCSKQNKLSFFQNDNKLDF